MTNVVWSSMEFEAIGATRCKGCGRREAACRAEVLKVFPRVENDDISQTSGQSISNADRLMERFMGMVR